jgi:hypothetical protein
MAPQTRVGELLDRAVKLILEALAQECPDLAAIGRRGLLAAYMGDQTTYAECSRQVDQWFADREGSLPLSAQVFKALADLFPDAAADGDIPDLGGE